MNKENVVYTHTVNNTQTFKKKECLQYVTTWMNLEDIMLNEIMLSQSQKDKCDMVPFT